MKNSIIGLYKLNNPVTKDIVKQIEDLDENSKILAKTYISALADKEKIKHSKNGFIRQVTT